VSAHTPGPWRYKYDVDQSDPLIIAADGTVVLGFDVGDWNAEARWLVEDADGFLLAAAPVLLAACQRAAATIDAFGPHPEATSLSDLDAASEALKAAIATATVKP